MNIGLTTRQGKGTINKIGKLTISLDNEIVLMICYISIWKMGLLKFSSLTTQIYGDSWLARNIFYYFLGSENNRDLKFYM